MNVWIIEDEMPAAARLERMLQAIPRQIYISGKADSVQSALQLLEGTAPDLIFLDIHLADGTAFDLLERHALPCPVVFTTAYDEYAIEAFKTASIGYLLKPVSEGALAAALEQYDTMRGMFERNGQVVQQPAGGYKKRFLSRYGEHIKTISADEIAYIYTEHKATFACTSDSRKYPLDTTLDVLEAMLEPETFFRVNRQYILSLKAIKDMRTHSKGRVAITLEPASDEAVVVSAERAAAFKRWLGSDF